MNSEAGSTGWMAFLSPNQHITALTAACYMFLDCWTITNQTRVPCSNAAKTRNPLKFVGVPQTTGSISAVSRPKFTILSGNEDRL